MPVTAAVLGLAMTMHAGPGGAQDALYGKQAPPGSSHVRFVNATNQPLVIHTASEADVYLGTGPEQRVGAFVAVHRPGGRALRFAVWAGAKESRLEVPAAPDAFVTVVLEEQEPGGIAAVPLTDRPEFNQTRTRLAFYNLLRSCPGASLVLDPGGGTVFAAIAADTAGARTVNPVQATVRADCGGMAGPPLALHGLQTGSSYSIWLMQPGGDATLTLSLDVQAPLEPRGTGPATNKPAKVRSND